MVASAHPAPRKLSATGGPGTMTFSTTTPGATDENALTQPSRAPLPTVVANRSTPLPSPRIPTAMGGRLAPILTTSSRPRTARTHRPCSSASRRAAATTGAMLAAV